MASAGPTPEISSSRLLASLDRCQVMIWRSKFRICAFSSGKPFTSEKNGSFAPSRAGLAQSTPFRRGTTAETSVWIKLTEPGGKLIHINLEHVTSVRSATVIPGARAQLELTSGKFQGVQEDVEQIMELISGGPGARENDEIPNTASVVSR